MTREYLLAEAHGLKQPSPKSAAEYEAHALRLAAQVSRLLEQRPDILMLIGADNLPMMHDNHRNHARFMASMFHAYQPQILLDTVLWVFRAYLAHGFRPAYWPVQLTTWVELFQSELSEQTRREIAPFYRWLIDHQAEFAKQAEENLSQDSFALTSSAAGLPGSDH